VPEPRRAEHLLVRHIDPAVRLARQCSRLTLDDEKVAKVIKEAETRLFRLRDALGDLYAIESSPARSTPLTFRSGSSLISAITDR
jgi:hypothetical protein